MFASVQAKLIGVVFVLCTSMIAMTALVLHDSHVALHAKMRQELGLELMPEIVEDGKAWLETLNDPASADALLRRAAGAHPQVALYLLTPSGDVLASSKATDALRLRHVNIAPLQRILAGERNLPLAGDNPSDPTRREVFSVAAIPATEPAKAYLYMILSDDGDTRSGKTTISSSYAFREGVVLLACWGALVLLAGLVVAKYVTRPLQRLTTSVERFQSGSANTAFIIGPEALPTTLDEIGRLAQSFGVMARRITQQMSDLRKQDANRRELFANVSHDLRTPLASLLGYLETISLKQHLSDEEKARYCEIATQEARHLKALVDDLLELAKLDAPEAKIRAERFALPELVQAVCRAYALMAQERGIALVKEISPSAASLFVCADPAMIERVLRNLLDNALRHTSAGGTVTVAVAAEQNVAMTTVCDTGVGIAPDDLPYIFDRFYRDERSGRDDHQGAGLGLTIVARILQLHGTAASVESRPGILTRFQFGLPIVEAESRVPS